jgi:pSer/pThr/pTyr-binding forkhead associated (FHA) protein
MAALIIKKNGQPYAQYEIQMDHVYTAGRKPDLDIPLDAEKAISREHLKIKMVNQTLNVECISKLGNLQVGGIPVLSAELNHGDTFSVGPFDFCFQTQATVTKASVDSISQVRHDDKTFVGKSNLQAFIRLVNSDGDTIQQFKLEGRDRWTAGRDATAEILISDHRVSRKQYEIRKIDQHYEISDLGSVNGTFINEKLLESQQSVSLKSGDLIRVLDHQMVFEIHDPHFFTKVERISPSLYEPQLQNEEAAQFEAQAEPVYGNEEQILLNPGSGSNPYYDPMAAHSMPTMEEDPKAARTKKIRVLILIVAIVGGLLYLMDSGDSSSTSAPPSAATPMGADPLSALTPQQKSEYRQSLELAKRYFMEGNYSLALSEVEELMKNFKVTDPDAEKLKNTAIAAIETQKQLIKQEKDEKERQVMEAKIRVTTQECQKKIEFFDSVEELDGCLMEALQLNPTHSQVLEVKAEFDALLADREMKRQQQAEINKRIAQLRRLFEQAEKTEKEGEYLTILDAYSKVTVSKLPDPGGLKKKADKRIRQLKKEMAGKIKKFEEESIGFEQKKNIRQAVLTLREAIKIDPTRDDLKDKAEGLKNELRKQMMEIYQEGILEESFGNVEGGDNRAGAKEKWKKIVDTDLPDGEYYQKAYIKLKKYGAQ